MVKQYNLTQGGVDELKAELAELKQRRVAVAGRLKAAKELGDLSENSDWSDAQDEHKFVEGRIAEIERVLGNVRIIKDPKGNSEVQLGSTVHLKYDGKNLIYTIVGSLESDPDAGKISDESPIGKALLGKKLNDTVDIKTPGGTTSYTITKIS